MFVVATATFRLLYTLIVLSLDRRRIVHFEVTANPTQDWLSNLTQLIALAKEKLEGGRSVWSSWDLQRDRLGMRGYARSP